MYLKELSEQDKRLIERLQLVFKTVIFSSQNIRWFILDHTAYLIS